MEPYTKTNTEPKISEILENHFDKIVEITNRNWRLCIVSIILLIIFNYWMVTYGCSTHLEYYNNLTVYGNCKDISGIVEKTYGSDFKDFNDNFVGYYKDNDNAVKTVEEGLGITSGKYIINTNITIRNITEVKEVIREINTTVYVNITIMNYTHNWTNKEIDILINHCNLREGASCFQSGSAKTCDKLREDLGVPGRPKFKTGPSKGDDPFWNIYTDNEDPKTFCFNDLGGYFRLIRIGTPVNVRNDSIWMNYTTAGWSWYDEDCRNGSMKVRHVEGYSNG